MEITYIVNPTAGGGRALRVWRSLLQADASIGERVYYTDEPGAAEELARRAAREGASAVVAVGGDGTLHEVVNGLIGLERAPAVGVIPCGTGNDFARSAGLPRAPRRALEVCKSGYTRRVDVGTINGRAFINVAGFGFDAAVAKEVASRPGGGTGAIPYLMAVLRLVRTYRPKEMTITVDGRAFRTPLLFGAVGNGSTYGGGMKICPRAAVDDGLFDLCLAHDLKPVETLANLAGVFFGAHVRHPKCSYRQAQRVEVDGPPEVLVHADGQLLGNLPARFELLPRAISFLFPRGAAHAGSSGSTSNSENLSRSHAE